VYVKLNIAAHSSEVVMKSSNYYVFWVCVCSHTMRMCHIVVYGTSGSSVLFHIIS